MENDHQCSWLADKKGAFSFLLSRKGTSIQTLHDSVHSLFITCFSLQLFRFLKIGWFFLSIFGHFMHVFFFFFYSLSKLNNNDNASCSIQRYVRCMNCGKNTSCLVTLAYKSCILLLCWIFFFLQFFKRDST